MKRASIIGATTLACALVVAYSANATNFTLSDSAIMSLDYNNSNDFFQPLPASIVSKQDIPGPGVQFTIHFPGTNLLDHELFQLSDQNYGAGTLAGIDVSPYSNFTLKFTVLSIDGSTSGNEILQVGSVIGPLNGHPWGYHPQPISLTGSYAPSAVSTTFVTSATASTIGFTVYFTDNGGWSAGPHDFTLLVQSASGAVQIPEPSTWAMLALAAVAFLGSGGLYRRSW
jgi:hypothetical protein